MEEIRYMLELEGWRIYTEAIQNLIAKEVKKLVESFDTNELIRIQGRIKGMRQSIDWPAKMLSNAEGKTLEIS